MLKGETWIIDQNTYQGRRMSAPELGGGGGDTIFNREMTCETIRMLRRGMRIRLQFYFL